jgi:predicted Holliday junction resolvase-like endonuclease
MDHSFVFVIAWIVLGIVVWYLISRIYFLIKLKNQRKDAVDRSRNVVMWQVNEKIAPLLPNFPYHYKDLTFLGKWVDYLVFDWLHRGNLQQIVFLEIKTWVSWLNKNEQMIRDCIENKKVSYKLMKL